MFFSIRDWSCVGFLEDVPDGGLCVPTLLLSGLEDDLGKPFAESLKDWVLFGSLEVELTILEWRSPFFSPEALS